MRFSVYLISSFVIGFQLIASTPEWEAKKPSSAAVEANNSIKWLAVGASLVTLSLLYVLSKHIEHTRIINSYDSVLDIAHPFKVVQRQHGVVDLPKWWRESRLDLNSR